MIEHQNTVIVIPTRMASSGLPGKPMVDVGGKPLIVHAWAQAREAKLGHVLVAAVELEIANAIKKQGGDAIVTAPQLKSQLDRAASALELKDPAKLYQNVVILAGDMPFLDANAIRRCLAGLTNEQVDAAILAAPLASEDDLTDGTIKIIAPLGPSREVAYVRDVKRNVPPDQAALAWQFVGVTAYRRATLEKLAASMPSQNEFARQLELMRALDLGHKVAAVLIDEAPLRVASRTALERARNLMKVNRE
jgi:3-deoxy-manno-octulosonate cytidylyltransferase (CMP-KDO synthetase)